MCTFPYTYFAYAYLLCYKTDGKKYIHFMLCYNKKKCPILPHIFSLYDVYKKVFINLTSRIILWSMLSPYCGEKMTMLEIQLCVPVRLGPLAVSLHSSSSLSPRLLRWGPHQTCKNVMCENFVFHFQFILLQGLVLYYQRQKKVNVHMPLEYSVQSIHTFINKVLFSI